MAAPITLKGFFGFQRHPFPPSCAPEPLFRSQATEAALRQAHNALASRLHLLVTGAAGLGKSCFCRLLLGELNPRDFRPLYLIGQPVGAPDLLRAIAEPLGLESSPRKGAAARLLGEGLEKIAATGGAHPVALVDEAQQLPLESIDFLRLVAERADRPLLSLVLVATDPFARLLARPALAPLAGRLPLRLRLLPLSVEEAGAFVDHAFTTVGMQNILAPSALTPLYTASGGSPRRLGSLVAAALERALEQRAKLLTDEIVQQVLDADTPTP
jgi:type II secretory pathway predicted ATPase ExeA